MRGQRSCVAFVATVSLLAQAVAASAADRPGTLVGPHQRVGGRTLSAWQAAWWRWRSALPYHTAAPSPDSCITSGQRGSVWFLGGDPSSQVSCSVPSGRYLLLGTPGVDCSTAEAPPFHARTNAGLLGCVRRVWRTTPSTYTVTLDGVLLRPSVVASPVFDVRMPAQDNYLLAPGHTRARAAVYGVVTMLRPLSPGAHTLSVAVQYPRGSPTSRVTYRLTVR